MTDHCPSCGETEWAHDCPNCQMERLLEALRRFPGTASVEDNTLAALRNLAVRVARLERQKEDTP